MPVAQENRNTAKKRVACGSATLSQLNKDGVRHVISVGKSIHSENVDNKEIDS